MPRHAHHWSAARGFPRGRPVGSTGPARKRGPPLIRREHARRMSAATPKVLRAKNTPGPPFDPATVLPRMRANGAQFAGPSTAR